MRLGGKKILPALQVSAAGKMRNIAVPDDVRRRILSESNDVVLRRWLTRAAIATNLTDVLS
ncbi:MAG: hypothetical protein IPK82_24555 [Polyangiaceae bacterium]|nr:hypothetical protein [Polyangiaceae bacterium]